MGSNERKILKILKRCFALVVLSRASFNGQSEGKVCLIKPTTSRGPPRPSRYFSGTAALVTSMPSQTWSAILGTWLRSAGSTSSVRSDEELGIRSEERRVGKECR